MVAPAEHSTTMRHEAALGERQAFLRHGTGWKSAPTQSQRRRGVVQVDGGLDGIRRIACRRVQANNVGLRTTPGVRFGFWRRRDSRMRRCLTDGSGSGPIRLAAHGPDGRQNARPDGRR